MPRPRRRLGRCLHSSRHRWLGPRAQWKQMVDSIKTHSISFQILLNSDGPDIWTCFLWQCHKQNRAFHKRVCRSQGLKALKLCIISSSESAGSFPSRIALDTKDRPFLLGVHVNYRRLIPYITRPKGQPLKWFNRGTNNLLVTKESWWNCMISLLGTSGSPSPLPSKLSYDTKRCSTRVLIKSVKILWNNESTHMSYSSPVSTWKTKPRHTKTFNKNILWYVPLENATLTKRPVEQLPIQVTKDQDISLTDDAGGCTACLLWLHGQVLLLWKRLFV